MTPFQKLKGEKSWPRFAKENSPGKQGSVTGEASWPRAQGFRRIPGPALPRAEAGAPQACHPDSGS